MMQAEQQVQHLRHHGSTSIKVHARANGDIKKAKAVGRLRDGLNTKRNSVVDALGN